MSTALIPGVSSSFDRSRVELPGGAVSVSTIWAQTALRASGRALAVDGRAGPATMEALRGFRAASAPSDPITPSADAESPSDTYPRRVVIGAQTEIALAAATLMPVALPRPAGSQTVASDTVVIGPNLDPPASATPTGRSSTPSGLVIGLGIAGAIGAGLAAWAITRRLARGGGGRRRSRTRRRAARRRRR